MDTNVKIFTLYLYVCKHAPKYKANGKMSYPVNVSHHIFTTTPIYSQWGHIKVAMSGMSGGNKWNQQCGFPMIFAHHCCWVPYLPAIKNNNETSTTIQPFSGKVIRINTFFNGEHLIYIVVKNTFCQHHHAYAY
jgi:hypothetical protein